MFQFKTASIICIILIVFLNQGYFTPQMRYGFVIKNAMALIFKADKSKSLEHTDKHAYLSKYVLSLGTYGTP
jgi:hypothetical protein